MGTGFETRAASHIAEGNNKMLITPELVHRRAVSKHPFLKFSLVFQGQFYYFYYFILFYLGPILLVIINIPNHLAI